MQIRVQTGTTNNVEQVIFGGAKYHLNQVNLF